ncbi:hypothetical protein AQZ52_10025 [Novosphingobium fuchskuhlense]|uniref:Uncharacterized protein n=1 Tax=Novosphingobium fuchskuhlense TaxID=1117702 RepID=A0A124JUA7_9SPHN|nr:hypothetical protein [Novosphingobium fuchskuhlense]KUR71029.1 hypothetical protein AQZ52_10025 [Novosphingobium fuchskuhlense]
MVSPGGKVKGARAITGDARLRAVMDGIPVLAKPDAVLIQMAAPLKGLVHLFAAPCDRIEVMQACARRGRLDCGLRRPETRALH